MVWYEKKNISIDSYCTLITFINLYSMPTLNVEKISNNHRESLNISKLSHSNGTTSEYFIVREDPR